MSIATKLDGFPVTQYRGLVWLALSDTAHVIGGTVSSDSGGDVVETSSSGTSIPCRIDPLGGGESTTAGKVSDRSTHVVTIPAETSITGVNKITITNRGTYEVTAVRDRTHEVVRVIEVVQT